MESVVVLTESELKEVIRLTALAVTADLRNDLQAAQHPELMNRQQLAEYLGIDGSTVNRFMNKGMPVERLGTTPRFRKADIDRWLKSNERFSHLQREAGTTRIEGLQ